MKKGLLFSLLFTISSILMAQTPVWTWSKSMGGRANSDAHVSSVKDNQGNVYISGEFEGTVNLGGTNYTSVGIADMFISKYDVNGTHLWTQTFGGVSNFMFPGGITIDNAGNIYATGTFSYRLDISGSAYYSANSTKDMYLIKVSPSGGILWTKIFGALGAEDAKCITTYNDLIYIGGNYNQTFTVGSLTLPPTNNNNINIYVLCLDTSGTGFWVSTGGGNNTDNVSGISASATSVHIGGYIQGAATFGTINVAGNGTDNDMLLAKLDRFTGAFQWAKGTGAASTDQIYSVGHDAYDNIYVCGQFYATVAFGGGITLAETSFPQGAYGDGFIAKYNASGTCLWARKMGGSSDDQTVSVAVASNGSVYATGYFRLAATFTSTTTPAVQLTTVGGSDFFAVKYGPTGNILWGLRGGGTSDDKGRKIMLDDNGYNYVMGNFFGSMTLSPLAAITSPSTASCAFLARLNGFSVGLDDLSSIASINLFPNPTADILNINLSDVYTIQSVEVYGVNGQLNDFTNVNNRTQNYQLNVANLKSGNYFVRVITSEGYIVKQFVKE